MTPPEQFSPILGYPNYVVSDHGRVINTKTDRTLAITVNRASGWRYVALGKAGEMKRYPLAGLVADAFLPVPERPNTSVLHIDGDRGNCTAYNLHWKARWFVVMYMKEINDRKYHIRRPFESYLTGRVYESIAELAMEEIERPSRILDILRHPGYYRVNARIGPIFYC